MNLHIILVRPQHPGNLGSVARAMANMGLSQLRLVGPLADRGDLEAIKMAMGGREVLEQSRVFQNLPEAIADLKLVVGTSRRRGGERDNFQTLREFAGDSENFPEGHPVGMVFGTEDKGLTKEELIHCQKILTIPSHPDCPSLNLAQAVMVVAYELFLTQTSGLGEEDPVEKAAAPLKDFEGMAEDWRRLLFESGFLDKENPEHTMRLVRNAFNRARLSAKDLAHPLIPETDRISNDLALETLGTVLLVTGSNMSGKSTFLRTLGINLCLAQAGAPVCAGFFEWTWVRLATCIRVDDSLEAGLSFFYAEVKRLKSLLDATKDRSNAPVVFLIDEIFKGTNNRERLIGSRSYISALSQGNGFGLVTTHDLELTDLDKTVPGLRNAHFQETVAAGALKFDYKLRPGPCPTTNALRIMELEGLPVPPPQT